MSSALRIIAMYPVVVKRNGGKMAMAAKAWREHKQSGGHFARKDGTVSDTERKKYKHTHDGPNPSDTTPKAPTSTTANHQGRGPEGYRKASTGRPRSRVGRGQGLRDAQGRTESTGAQGLRDAQGRTESTGAQGRSEASGKLPR